MSPIVSAKSMAGPPYGVFPGKVGPASERKIYSQNIKPSASHSRRTTKYQTVRPLYRYRTVRFPPGKLNSLWLHDELSFKWSFRNYDRITMITRQFNYKSIRISLPGNSYVMKDELLTKSPSDFLSIDLSTGINDHILVYDNKNYLKKGGFLDPEAGRFAAVRISCSNYFRQR